MQINLSILTTSSIISIVARSSYSRYRRRYITLSHYSRPFSSIEVGLYESRTKSPLDKIPTDKKPPPHKPPEENRPPPPTRKTTHPPEQKPPRTKTPPIFGMTKSPPDINPPREEMLQVIECKLKNI